MSRNCGLSLAPDEQVGILTLPKNSCDVIDIKSYPKWYIHSYFSTGIEKYKQLCEYINVANIQYQHDKKTSNIQYHNGVYETLLMSNVLKYIGRETLSYIKCVWLADELLRDGRFYDILTGHWNPDLKKFSIAPGVVRSLVDYYFNNTVADYLIFNTGKQHLQWKVTYNTYEQLEEGFLSYRNYRAEQFFSEFVSNDVNIYYMDRYNRQVPYIHASAILRIDQLLKYNKLIYDFFTTTELTADFDLTEYGYDKNLVTNKIRSKTIDTQGSTIEQTEENIIRAFILMPLFNTYKGYGISIN